ncbi:MULTISPECIES: c-type cytochrome [Hyphomonas]|uniref:Cytochrome c, class I n=1 Tax=Hyphomonas adhaerens TaxID=81029 RepID=A0A3B9H151_9PROT|nr:MULTISPECIES: cytochrome c [Hyphomonas]MBB38518.1 cytochrome c, class I [Hyphomonas sp.]HAE28411.1 cytochrome c, class I [Hyphomonas adhaerens]|tara:strand:+ start:5757 stop:6071 length:315 start_codon:yes stop_codon:yes gene_type:complete
MKSCTLPVFALAAVFLTGGFAAIGQPPPEDTSVIESPPETDPMQIVRGATAWKETCSRCHNLRSPSELTDEEWEVSVTHMRVRGNLPASEVQDILAFLQASNNQ